MCEVWSGAEIRKLRALLPASIEVLAEALAPRTGNSIMFMATRLGLRELILRKRKNWRAICNNHKPRIVLATAFPIEQEGGK
jgi:hypothetical protein